MTALAVHIPVDRKIVNGPPGLQRLAWDWNTPAVLYATLPESGDDVGDLQTAWEAREALSITLCSGYIHQYWLRCPTSGHMARALAEALPVKARRPGLQPENLLSALVALSALVRQRAANDDLRLLEALLPANLSPGTRPLRIMRRWLRHSPEQQATGTLPVPLPDHPQPANELFSATLREFHAASQWPVNRATLDLWIKLNQGLVDYFLQDFKKFEAEQKRRFKAVGFERRGKGGTTDVEQQALEDGVRREELKARLLARGHGLRRIPLILRNRPDEDHALPLGTTLWRPGLERRFTPLVRQGRLHLMAGADPEIAASLRTIRQRPTPMPLALILDVSTSLEDRATSASSSDPALNFYESVLGLGLDMLASAPSGTECAVATFARETRCSGWRQLPTDRTILEGVLFSRSNPDATHFPVEEFMVLQAASPAKEALLVIATDGDISSQSLSKLAKDLPSRSPNTHILAIRPPHAHEGSAFFQCIVDNGGQVLDVEGGWNLGRILELWLDGQGQRRFCSHVR